MTAETRFFWWVGNRLQVGTGNYPYWNGGGRREEVRRRSGRLIGQVLVLTHVEVVVEAFGGEEGVVRAAFDDPAVVDDEELVGLADRAQAVGDDEGGTAVHEAQQPLLDLLLGARVDAAGGLVEDEDARVGQDGAGDG